MSVTLTFMGGTDEVTGSRTLVESAGRRVLVDCGLFQGVKRLRERNWNPFPVEPTSLDAVVLTHAHIDHSGYLPRLVALGFNGHIYCTDGTRDLLEILLPDAAYLQEEDAARANRYGYSRHGKALPLYTGLDAMKALSRVRSVRMGTGIRLTEGIEASFSRAGHILGAACVSLVVAGQRVTFSGDVGRPNDPIMRAPEPLAPCDVLVVESTYGDRKHPSSDAQEELGRVIRETFARQGSVIIPAFAVGRCQHILHALANLREAGRIPQIPIFLDSPMAIGVTEVFSRYSGEHRLDRAALDAMNRVAKFTRTVVESKAISALASPAVIIAASGMATGGRVLHHLHRCLPDERNTILIMGFQAAGTRGRHLQNGAEEIKLHGECIPVRAHVEQIEGLSAHGDAPELISWLKQSQINPSQVFVNHGEPSSSDAFRRRLRDAFGWKVTLPGTGSRYLIGNGG